MDQTQLLWELVKSHTRAGAVDEEKLTKLRAAQILRSFAARSDFTDVALQVAKNIEALASYVQQNRRDYIQPGKLSETERDRVEAHVGEFLRTCKQNIERLQSSASAERGSVTEDTTAHRLGVALVLSERLQLVGGVFDRARAVRYQQKQQQQLDLERRQQSIRLTPVKRPAYQQNGEASPYDPSSASPWRSTGGDESSPAQQQALAVESQALLQELEELGQGAFKAESTVRELAALNQMFSVQIVQQAEQIELLYNQAVQATTHVDRGNVHLGKAIRHNTSARWYVFWILMCASLCLLFLDWYSS